MEVNIYFLGSNFYFHGRFHGLGCGRPVGYPKSDWLMGLRWFLRRADNITAPYGWEQSAKWEGPTARSRYHVGENRGWKKNHLLVLNSLKTKMILVWTGSSQSLPMLFRGQGEVILSGARSMGDSVGSASKFHGR